MCTVSALCADAVKPNPGKSEGSLKTFFRLPFAHADSAKDDGIWRICFKMRIVNTHNVQNNNYYC